MRIAIDAFRTVCERHTSGANYVAELARCLDRIDEVEQVVLLSPYEPDDEIRSQFAPSRKIRFVFPERRWNPMRSWMHEFAWVQRALPSLVARCASRDGLDWTIAPYHQTPVRMPRGVAAAAVIHDLCGLKPECGYRRFGRGYMRHLANFVTAVWSADLLIPISEFTREELLTTFPSTRSRVSVPVYNSITLRRIPRDVVDSTLARMGITPPFFFAYGLPGPRKGTDLLLRAYARYRREGGTTRLVMIGGREGQEFWRELLSPEAIGEPLWLSRIADIERDSLYAAARCLVFPSRCEGFGYPILEAMGQATPVIAWRNSPAAEIVGGSMALLDDLTPESICAALWTYDRLPTDDRAALGEQLVVRAAEFGERDVGRQFFDVMHAAGRA